MSVDSVEPRHVRAELVLDLQPFKEGWETISVAIGPNNDVLLLGWRGAVEGLWEYRIVHVYADRERVQDIPETFMSYFWIQPLPGDRYVLIGNELRSNAPNVAVIFDSASSELRRFETGSYISQFSTNRQGDIWIGYSDQGVFSDTVGQNGLTCFDTRGQLRFGFNQDYTAGGLWDIVDVYAMNVVSASTVWIWYYTGFPLVKVVDRRVEEYWTDLAALTPATYAWTGFAVDHGRVLFGGGLKAKSVEKDEKGRLIPEERLALIDLSTRQVNQIVTLDQYEQVIRTRNVVGRGSMLYLITEVDVYRVSLRDL